MSDTPTFLEEIAKKILTDYANFLDVEIVLPNKRAKIFLEKELKAQSNQFIIAPKILSIEELIGSIAQMQSIDSQECLFEFYKVYATVESGEVIENFDDFYNWAKLLLIDFNDIDTYLLAPDKVFDYLNEIDHINRWDISGSHETKHIESQQTFWKKLPIYYQSFVDYMEKSNKGYNGYIYRKAANRVADFIEKNKTKTYIFCGFNALTKAEEHIFQKMLEAGIAKVYWNIDRFFIENHDIDSTQDEVLENEVGFFARRIKRQWKYYKSHPFEGINDYYCHEKKIHIIGTPKNVGQAALASKLVENLQSEVSDLSQTAVVLGEEAILPVVLNALPKKIGGLNITMGASIQTHPSQLLIERLLRMLLQAYRRPSKSYYYKDVLAVLDNPIVATDPEVIAFKARMVEKNWVYFSSESIRRFVSNSSGILNKIATLNLGDSTIEILIKLKEITEQTRRQFQNENDKIALTFTYGVYKTLHRLEMYQNTYQLINTLENLYAIYNEIVQEIEVSFEGEPLEGLQIMGVLESRVLDFKNVIITNVNEGIFPRKKAPQTFIPYDVKLELGLPTFKKKDAIFAYHFFHLLHRAQNVYLLYSNDESGNDNEPSRYIYQLQMAKKGHLCPNHTIEFLTYKNPTSDIVQNQWQIQNTQLLQKRVEEFATQRGFSPSSITNYFRNPWSFYLQNILKIREHDEVEEDIALNTLGTIIHDTLEQLYSPYIGVVLTPNIIEQMLLKYEVLIIEKFKEYFSEQIVGKSRLAYEMAKMGVFQFLEYEKERVSDNEVIIFELEKRMETTIEDARLPYPIKLKGFIDRIERNNGVLQIIDYKTGTLNGLTVSNGWNSISNLYSKSKEFQLFCYALMAQKDFADEVLQLQIYSFKQQNPAYTTLMYKKNALITTEAIEDFREILIEKLCEITNVETIFKDEPAKSYY